MDAQPEGHHAEDARSDVIAVHGTRNSRFRLAPARNDVLLERSGGILSQGPGLRLAGGSNQNVEHLARARIQHLFVPLRRKDLAEAVRLLNERGQPDGQGA